MNNSDKFNDVESMLSTVKDLIKAIEEESGVIKEKFSDVESMLSIVEDLIKAIEEEDDE